LRDYYQSEGLGLTVPEEFSAAWMLDRLPFYSFEDVNFPLAMASACVLLERLRTDPQAARHAFFGVQGRTGTDLSYELLTVLDIDLATPAPFEAAMRRMRSLIAELDQVLSQSG
jgi:oligoendopeptidase F